MLHTLIQPTNPYDRVQGPTYSFKSHGQFPPNRGIFKTFCTVTFLIVVPGTYHLFCYMRIFSGYKTGRSYNKMERIIMQLCYIDQSTFDTKIESKSCTTETDSNMKFYTLCFDSDSNLITISLIQFSLVYCTLELFFVLIQKQNYRYLAYVRAYFYHKKTRMKQCDLPEIHS